MSRDKSREVFNSKGQRVKGQVAGRVLQIPCSIG